MRTQTVLKDHVDPLCPEGMNTADEPRRITSVTRKVKLAGSEFRQAFAPFSVTRLDVQLHAGR